MNVSLQLGALVAEGRLATVHRGALGGRAVAVKRANGAAGAADALRREGRILAAAAHPAIVPVLDVIEDPFAPALVLGWADGGSLEDMLADGPLAVAELLHLLRPVADGLDAMHLAGVAHLDVNVRNVLLAAIGPVLVDPAPPGAGTPGYADPVVVAGGPPSARSDVFGLAACAHVALTGRLPRPGGGVAVGVSLEGPVADVLAAGLHPEPGRRPASPPAFVDRLEAALTGSSLARNGPGAAPRPVAVRPGRPVARAPLHDLGPPARTWPFDRWLEEEVAGQERRAALAATVGATGGARPARRRRAARSLVLLVVSVIAAAAGLRSPGVGGRPTPVRSSAPDSTQRPPAARPPPTATPGGKP